MEILLDRYHSVWAWTDPYQIPKQGYLFGGKNLTKMLQFRDLVEKLGNEEIDWWMHQQFEKEDPERRLKQKFVKQLLKHRHHIYEFKTEE